MVVLCCVVFGGREGGEVWVENALENGRNAVLAALFGTRRVSARVLLEETKHSPSCETRQDSHQVHHTHLTPFTHIHSNTLQLLP